MRIVVGIILLGLLGPAPAWGKKLASRVERLDLDPAAVVVEEASGATALERYRARAPGPLPAAKPLVLLVRSRELSSADTIAVTRAELKDHTITVEIEIRRFTGPLAANVVTIPLTEVTLGELPKGTYRAKVSETLLEFSQYEHPETASSPVPGAKSDLTLETR